MNVLGHYRARALSHLLRSYVWIGFSLHTLTPSIVILTGNHLCHNPRVLKEVMTISRCGFAVEVLGAWFDPVLQARDMEMLPGIPFKFTPVLRLDQSALAKFGLRLRTRIANASSRLSGMESEWQLGPVLAALRQAAEERSADLFIAHSETALAVATNLLHQGRRVGVDMEDWFSEDLLPTVRKRRPLRLLRRLEQTLLRGAVHSSCPSQAMSAALANEFKCRPPTVIYNAFEWSERERVDGLLKDRRTKRVPTLHWYSQTLGAGRGLEDLFAALVHVKHDLEIHLRGQQTPGFCDWMELHIPETWRRHIYLHPLVPNEELLSRIAEHDIGFAGEMTFARSRDLTVTNKILHYLLAGLAVVASATAGQREVAAQAGEAVHLYPVGDAVSLATVLNTLLMFPDKLKASREAALKAAKKVFSWEQQSTKLIESVTRAAEKSPPINE